MSVSLFQDLLLHRVKRHADFVKRFKLGWGISIYEELKNKLSQVWELIRNDDERQQLSYAAVVRKGVIPSRFAYMYKIYIPCHLTTFEVFANHKTLHTVQEPPLYTSLGPSTRKARWLDLQNN